MARSTNNKPSNTVSDWLPFDIFASMEGLTPSDIVNPRTLTCCPGSRALTARPLSTSRPSTTGAAFCMCRGSNSPNASRRLYHPNGPKEPLGSPGTAVLGRQES
jgi:hypothetical protein